MQKYQWLLSCPDENICNLLVKEINISSVLAKILVNRNIVSVKEAKSFLYADLNSISSPFTLPDMQKAVAIIKSAIENKKKIVIYGDYDADGITSTYVLSAMLEIAGADVQTYIPSRMDEGYGLNLEALEKLLADGIQLLITVDCGIASVDEIHFAQTQGMECIITDHHTPPETLPPAQAIINPKLMPQNIQNYDLAGVGVAWKTGWAVLEEFLGEQTAKEQANKFIDVVALGTVADMVSLLGENRVIVKYGLEKLAHTDNIGLQALIANAGIDGKMDTYKIGFVLGPRLNAVGRMSNADKALKLLRETNPAQAKAWAVLLSAENTSRQNVEKEILQQAEQLMEEQAQPDDKVLVVASEAWHEGVVGIVASKLQDKFYRPVICMTIKEHEAKGSARSIEGFNIYEAIKACSVHLTRFGGHAMAAGISLNAADLEAFRRAINKYAEEHLTEEMLVCSKQVDAEIDLSSVTPELVKELSMLEPYGQGNKKPVFLLKDILFLNERKMGKNNEHILIGLKQKDSIMQGIAWGMADKLSGIRTAVDILFTPQENSYNGRTSIQALILDSRYREQADTMMNIKKSLVLQQLVKSGKTSWDKIEGYTRQDMRRFFPDRDILAVIYKLLQSIFKIKAVYSEEEIKKIAFQQGLPWETFYLALVVFYELKLIGIQKDKESVKFSLEHTNQKVELDNSPLYRRIKEEYNLLQLF